MTLDTDTAYRAAEFVETFTGGAFWPLAPKAEHVSIIDIVGETIADNRFEFVRWNAVMLCVSKQAERRMILILRRTKVPRIGN